MMNLVVDGELQTDRFLDVSGAAGIPAGGSIIVSLDQWLANLDSLIARRDPFGIRLRSDQHPEIIADDLDHLAVIALEFPSFRDGRAYSHARLLRERWGFRGELRAVGDVLPDQLHFMQRVGFNAFEIRSADALRAWRTATSEFSVWYQATGDGRIPAAGLRHRPAPARKIA
jgi:uncharacterized protein (DUF934 family)